ncbi:MAG: hypothetical protein AMXMBFR48_18990 [Ignavibacteriales bacterium]
MKSKMVLIRAFLIVGIFSILNLGCAAIFKSSLEPVSFASEPVGADVYIDGQKLGTTPFQLALKPSKTYTIEFKKEGYTSRTVILNNKVGAGWVVLDILGGLLPVVIDAATGAWYTFEQDQVKSYLEINK